MSNKSNSLQDQQIKLALARVVGALLAVDGHIDEQGRAFLSSLIRAWALTDEVQQRVWETTEGQQDVLADIERLRRHGATEILMTMLRGAASLDGVVTEKEEMLINQVEDAIRLRLGAARYPIQLKGLDDFPLSERYGERQKIGEGGFGVVYRAIRKDTKQKVVIKELRAELHRELDTRNKTIIEDRFWREVAVIGTLSSPYSVRLLGAGFDRRAPYMVLEFIEGRTLFDLLQEQGAMEVSRVRHLILQVLHAVVDAHSKGVIHRDLKSDNIMISGSGTLEVARVLDYGLAGIMSGFEATGHITLTVAGQVMGTPSYMPPEQITDFKQARPQNDLYALGLIILECLTGLRVVRGETNVEILKWQRSEETLPIPLEVARTPFGSIIAKACDKNWQKRYDSANQMMVAIENMFNNAGSSHASDNRPGLLTRLWRKITGGSSVPAIKIPPEPLPKTEISPITPKLAKFDDQLNDKKS